MKTTRPWEWLAAAVLAAGLNASYHDGGLRWAHQIVDGIESNARITLAQASGRVDLLLAEARVLAGRQQPTACPWSAAVARVQSRLMRSEAVLDRMSAREQAQLARLDANRARMEAQFAAHGMRFDIPAATFAPVDFKALPAPVVCPRVRVNIPRIPMLRMSPEVRIETGSPGPV